jgi:steroid delta-isomerase-like uncharacterized protein
MTTTQSSIAQRWVDGWNSHDVTRILACLTADAVYEDLPLGAVNHGHDEARQFIEFGWAAFPDLRFELTGTAIRDGGGTAEWTMLGTQKGDLPGLPATGKSFSVRGVSVMELAGDQIRAVRDYWDYATVLQQLGVLPPAAATS